MSRQRNEPNDPTMELLDYEPSEAGTSEDDKGEIRTETNPNGVDFSEWDAPKQEKAAKDWINSTYTELTHSNFRKLSEGKDYSVRTARKAVMRAFPGKRTINDLRESEQLAVAVFAYEGVNASLNRLEEIYKLSTDTLRFARDTYQDLIEQYEGAIDQEQLYDAVDRYQDENATRIKDGNEELKWDIPTGSEEYERQKEIVENYFAQNPNAGAEEVLNNTDAKLEATRINSIKGNMTKHGRFDNHNNETDTQNADIADLKTRMDKMQDALESIYEYTHEMQKNVYPSTSNTTAIDEDIAYKIIADEELTSEERRQIFDAVVGDQ